jgi:hypothetical protein
MNRARFAALPLAPAALLLALGACQSETAKEADRTGDIIEQQAEASAEGGGAAIMALGLTEAQLIEADLVTFDGTDLGDVEQVRRDAAGEVEALVVKLENTDPDRFVLVPITGLAARPDGNDTDVETTMSAADLAALPDAQVGAQPAETPPA